jgi:hypothetical protein
MLEHVINDSVIWDDSRVSIFHTGASPLCVSHSVHTVLTVIFFFLARRDIKNLRYHISKDFPHRRIKGYIVPLVIFFVRWKVVYLLMWQRINTQRMSILNSNQFFVNAKTKIRRTLTDSQISTTPLFSFLFLLNVAKSPYIIPTSSMKQKK